MGKVQAIRHGTQASNSSETTYGNWFRGEHTNFNPSRAQLVDETDVSKHILHGWVPDTPLIGTETQVTAFGSCFASNISDWLSARNFRVRNRSDKSKRAYVVNFGEGMVNSFVIRQQFEWAWENKVFDQPLWHGYTAEEFGYDPEIQAETKAIFDDTDVFILTFGLSEVWYDEPTGNVFWRTVPRDAYDPERHRFRVSTVEENRDNLEAIYQLIRKHRPEARIIYTLSPILLIATFRDNSCIASNSVSKAVLRVAIDEVVRAHQDEGYLYYWPSHEIITDVFNLPYKADRRHLDRKSIAFVMTLFEHVWCHSGPENQPKCLRTAWLLACARTGLLPAELEDIVQNRRKVRLRKRLKSDEPLDDDPETDAAKPAYLARVLDDWVAADSVAKTDVAAE